MQPRAFLANVTGHWPALLGIAVLGALAGLLGSWLYVALLAGRHGAATFAGRPVGLIRAQPRIAAAWAKVFATTLLSGQELLSRLDPTRLADEIELPLRIAAEDIIVGLAARHQLAAWEILPMRTKKSMLDQFGNATPELIRRILHEIAVDVDDVLNIENLVNSALVSDTDEFGKIARRLIGNVFAVFTRMATTIGLGIAIVGALLIAASGYFWLALPFGVLGCWLSLWFAGEFALRAFRRQRGDIATWLADEFAVDIVNFGTIVDELTNGQLAGHTMSIIRREIQRLIDQRMELIKPVLAAMIGPRRFQQIRNEAIDRAIRAFPAVAGKAAEYANAAMAVRATLAHRIRRLPSTEYDRLITPILHFDRVRLVTGCAAIGLLTGAIALVTLVLGG